jgi:AcrR family transcriptional regulator
MARKKVEENYEEAKQKIIRSSIEMLFETSFSKFTLASVAERAGITKAAIYWYFPNKEKLLEEVASELQYMYVQSTHAIANLSISPLEKLNEIFKPHIEPFMDIMCILPIKLFFEFYSEENTIKHLIQQSYEDVIKTVAAIIQEGIEKGEFCTVKKPHELASFVICMLDGAGLQNMILSENRSAKTRQMAYEIFISCLKKGEF